MAEAGGSGPGVTPPVDLYEQVVEAAADAILVVDSHGTVVLCNGSAEKLFGRTAAELSGRPVDDLVPAAARSRHRALREGYGADPRPRPMGTGLVLRAERGDGTLVPVEISLSPVAGRDRFVVAVIRDVSERERVEAERTAAQEELLGARHRTERLQDRERIARDLHDSVIQRLFAAGMRLQGVLPRVEDAEVFSRVDSVVGELDAAIRDIRQSIFQVENGPAAGRDVRTEIVELAEELTPVLGVRPDILFAGPLDTLVSPEIRVELMPMVREALTNCARHAAARRVRVSLRVVDHHLEVEVSDDGRGMPVERGAGRGLANLAERTKLLGGELEVGQAEGGGTRVSWVLPLKG